MKKKSTRIPKDQKRIRDLPGLESSLIFIEYDVPSLKGKIDNIVAVVEKPASLFGEIPLNKVRLELDEEVDGWNIFISHKVFQNCFWFYKFNHLLKEAHQFAFDDVLRESLEKCLLHLEGDYLEGDMVVKRWLVARHLAGAKCNFIL